MFRFCTVVLCCSLTDERVNQRWNTKGVVVLRAHTETPVDPQRHQGEPGATLYSAVSAEMVSQIGKSIGRESPHHQRVKKCCRCTTAVGEGLNDTERAADVRFTHTHKNKTHPPLRRRSLLLCVMIKDALHLSPRLAELGAQADEPDRLPIQVVLWERVHGQRWP